MLRTSIRAVIVAALLSVAAISLQGCAYDPYTGTYVPYAASAYGYYGYPDYPYYYPPSTYGAVEISGSWGWGGYHGWHGHYGGWHH